VDCFGDEVPVLPKVSIIIPAYNASLFIGDAIRSALSQTYAALEVVVVDDGSVDDTARIVQAINESRLRYIYQQNQGQSTAINRGVSLSSGDYIKLLDADDWMNPAHVASQVKALNGSVNNVASCRWGYFLNDFLSPVVRDEVTNVSYDDPMQWMFDSLAKDEGMMGGWMWLMPRRIWEATGGYDESLTLYNDVHFSTKLLLAAKGVRFAPDAVYSYRRGVATSMSVDQGYKTMESIFRASDMAVQLLIERNAFPEFRQLFADRLQMWLYRFYPHFPDLVRRAERRIAELGGSNLKMPGGHLQKMLLPIIGWKGVRNLQEMVYRIGWQKILARKASQRLSGFR
jgi:glycosyltransferase involved in cell wall biosynthesis